MQFVILSSSRGTTMQAVLEAIDDRSLNMQCLGLISDTEDRGCVEKARSAGLKVLIVSKEDDEDRESYDKKIDAACAELGADDTTLIATLGWMFILSEWFVTKWSNRIINVHPALLPAHPGGHAIRDTIKSGDQEAGMTIHIIDKGVDTGPILVQKKCTVEEGETEETLKKKIQELEKEWYPNLLQSIESGAVVL
jgi:phosphoribosylglycinamide formyltransferase-1